MAVAEGGNQTIVSVGVAVRLGRGVSVGEMELKGKQAIRESSPVTRNRIRESLIQE